MVLTVISFEAPSPSIGMKPVLVDCCQLDMLLVASRIFWMYATAFLVLVHQGARLDCGLYVGLWRLFHGLQILQCINTVVRDHLHSGRFRVPHLMVSRRRDNIVLWCRGGLCQTPL